MPFTVLSVSGCDWTGIHVQPGQILPSNAALPMEKLENDVDQPDMVRFDLADYCGHLVLKNDKGLFEPLFVSAYPANDPPTTSAPSGSGAQPIYHALIDEGGTASLNAALPASASSVSVTGQDRLEVTVSTVAICHADTADAQTLQDDLTKLRRYRSIPEDRVYYVSFASQTQMTVDSLTAITGQTKLAPTPIVAFGAQAYSKNSATKIANYIYLLVGPALALSSQPTGSTLAATPAANTPPVTAAPSSTATGAPISQPATSSSTVSPAAQHAMTPAIAAQITGKQPAARTNVVSPAVFQTTLNTLKNQKSIQVQ